MADQWKELAQDVPVGLISCVYAAEESHRLIERVRGDLVDRANSLRRVHLGTPPAVTDPEPVVIRAFPPVSLEDARREIGRGIEEHAMAGHVFALSSEHLDIQTTSQWQHRQDWDSNHAAARLHAREALKRIRAASLSDTASVDAFAIAARLPEGNPLRRLWMLTTEQLLNAAAHEASMAQGALRSLRQAVALQFVDAIIMFKLI